MKRNKVSNSLCRVFLLLLIAVQIVLMTPAFGQAQSDLWLILASGESGSIKAHTTRAELVRMYGPANVVDQDIDMGEGDMEPATFLFPEDPERQLEIVWKDPSTKVEPASAEIRGKKSRWHAAHGVTLGTSVSELERINGRPFHFALTNAGTDQADELILWRGGALQKEFAIDGQVALGLEWTPAKGAKPSRPSDFKVDSDNASWLAQNPHVVRMTWVFPVDKRE
jgi:hypothetical protein